MIADCLSCIVCQDTAEDDDTVNLHVTTFMMFQDGKLQNIYHQTLLDPQLVKLAKVIQNGWGEIVVNWMQIYMHSECIDSTCTLQMASS